jgi:hypothetical protein
MLVLASCGGRRLPPYRSRAPRGLPASVSASSSVPPAPDEGPLALDAVVTIGVRFESNGEERGPYGARRPLWLPAYEPSYETLLRSLRDELRVDPARIGLATGAEDLEVLVVLRSFMVDPRDCVRERELFCEGLGCSTTTCTRPARLAADFFLRVGDVSRGPFPTTVSGDADDGLPEVVDQAFRSLGTRLAELLRARRLR